MPEVPYPYTCNVAPNLPIRPHDGQTVCDSEGNVWQYEAETDSWVERGAIATQPSVSEEQDGLVTPDIYNRLTALKNTTIPPTLKLLPNTDVYWYLFHSSDKLIRFTPEGPSQLRIEVDRGRLFSVIAGHVCRGKKGPQGIDGPAGIDGASGGPEPCFAPDSVSADGTILAYNITVEAPLATDISIRLADSATSVPVVTILLPVGGEPVLDPNNPPDPSISLNQTLTLDSISYDAQSQLLTGSFVSAANPWAQRCILARQKGPVGPPGAPGVCFPQVSSGNVSYSDAGIQFTTPLIALRKGYNSEQLFAIAANLFGDVCVSQLTFNTGAPDYANLFTTPFINSNGTPNRALAAHMTLDSCKDIAVFSPTLVVAPQPDLELPAWQPQGDCTVAKRAQISDFNWPPTTGNGPPLQIPDGQTSSLYPWQIVIPPASAAGDCDPCAPSDSQSAPCPDNTPTTTTAAPSPPAYLLVSEVNGECVCVTPSTPYTGTVLGAYASDSDCQVAKLSLCGSPVAGVYYQLRYDPSTSQCSCVDAVALLGDALVLGTYDTMQMCVVQQNNNADCVGTGLFSSWYSVAGDGCYCLPINVAPQSSSDAMLGSLLAQAQCAAICVPNPNSVIFTCANEPASWDLCVFGSITYSDGSTKAIGFLWNNATKGWDFTDSDGTFYRFILGGALNNCLPSLDITQQTGDGFVINGILSISGNTATVLFHNTIQPSLIMMSMVLYGTGTM